MHAQVVHVEAHLPVLVLGSQTSDEGVEPAGVHAPRPDHEQVKAVPLGDGDAAGQGLHIEMLLIDMDVLTLGRPGLIHLGVLGKHDLIQVDQVVVVSRDPVDLLLPVTEHLSFTGDLSLRPYLLYLDLLLSDLSLLVDPSENPDRHPSGAELGVEELGALLEGQAYLAAVGVTRGQEVELASGRFKLRIPTLTFLITDSTRIARRNLSPCFLLLPILLVELGEVRLGVARQLGYDFQRGVGVRALVLPVTTESYAHEEVLNLLAFQIHGPSLTLMN